MKLLAISDSGTRLKDFVDIAYLSTKMSLIEMLSCYKKNIAAQIFIMPQKVFPILAILFLIHLST